MNLGYNFSILLVLYQSVKLYSKMAIIEEKICVTFGFYFICLCRLVFTCVNFISLGNLYDTPGLSLAPNNWARMRCLGFGLKQPLKEFFGGCDIAIYRLATDAATVTVTVTVSQSVDESGGADFKWCQERISALDL